MNYKYNILQKLVATIPVILLAYSQASAFVAISYDGMDNDYVSADSFFNGQATKSGTVDSRPFSAVNQLNPQSGYSGPAYYGGYQASGGTGTWPAISRDEVRNNFSGVDPIFIQVGANDTPDSTVVGFQGLILFQQNDFLNGLDSGSVQLESLSATVGYRAAGTQSGDATYHARWLVATGGSYFLSQTMQEMPGEGTVTPSLSGTDLTSELWATYDPSTDLNFDQSVASFSSLSLDSITGVGIYFENDAYLEATGFEELRFSLQTFEATAVPEPSTVALFLGLGALGLAWHSRRSR